MVVRLYREVGANIQFWRGMTDFQHVSESRVLRPRENLPSDPFARYFGE